MIHIKGAGDTLPIIRCTSKHKWDGKYSLPLGDMEIFWRLTLA